MQQTEDDTFLFRFSFIETDSEKGFVTHYQPNHPPLCQSPPDCCLIAWKREFQTRAVPAQRFVAQGFAALP